MNQDEKKIKSRMRPVIILPAGMMSACDIKSLNANGFCVVRAKDPSQVRFIDPPPMGYSAQEKAAISLCRWIMGWPESIRFNRCEVASKLAEIFIEGSPLAHVPSVRSVKK